MNKMTIWEGIFEEKPIVCRKIFSSEKWLKRCLDHLRTYREKVEQDKNSLPPRQCILPNIIGLIHAKRIVDWGGGSGWVWDFTKNSIVCDFVEEYLIIENKELIELLKSQNLHDHPVSLTDEIKNRIETDVFYTNSTLQYVDDDEFLKVFGKIKSTILIFEDFLGNVNDFWTLQKYNDQQIPVKFRNVNKFIQLIRGYKYSLISSTPYCSIINKTISKLI